LKQKAVALSYSPNISKAPKIVASGEGFFAKQMINQALQNRVEIVSDKALVDSLVRLPIGSEIPKEMYDSVAIIFRYLLSTQEKKNN